MMEYLNKGRPVIRKLEFDLIPSTNLSVFKMNMLAASDNYGYVFVGDGKAIQVLRYNRALEGLSYSDCSLQCGESELNKIAVKTCGSQEYLLAVDDAD